MNSESQFVLYEQATVWANQFRTDPSFTISDAEELKCHLLDISEDLVLKGLSENEAFAVAISRLGDPSTLKNEFEEINTPIIQLRKALLVLSGILAFSLLYYFIYASTDLLVLVLDHINGDYVLNFRYVVSFTLALILIIVISTVILYFSDDRRIKLFEKIKMRPGHLFLLFLGTLILALMDQWFRQLFKIEFNPGSYTATHLYALFDYLNYILPFVLIVNSIILFWKFDRTVLQSEACSNSYSEIQTVLNDKPIQYSVDYISGKEPDFQFKSQLVEIECIGLSKEEALCVMKLRDNVISLNINRNNLPSNPNRFNYDLLLVFSSVLVYFFLHFLMNSTSRILITVFQYFENDPSLNIRRTLSFILSFQCFFILLAVALYFLDKKVVRLINQHHIKPVHTLLLFLVTILFAFLDRLFLPISKNCLGYNMALKYKLMNIIYVSDFTLPFILCACFLILFNKYYRDNIRICK